MRGNGNFISGTAPRWTKAWPSIALPLLLLAAAVTGIGLYAYGAAKKVVTQNMASDMEAIARLKAEQIELWLSERQDDAKSVMPPALVMDLQQWMDGGGQNNGLRKRLIEHLQFRNIGHYRDISLLSPTDGKVLMTAAGHPDLPSIRAKALESARLGATIIEDIHHTEGMNPTGKSIGLFSPVFPAKGSKPLVIVHVTMDAGATLFPILEKWPGASTSGEILLLRREGSDLAYLNAPRRGGRPSLHARTPAAKASSIGSQLSRQGVGFFEGADHRGVASLAFGLPVEGTPWFVMARMNRDEAYLPLNTIAALSATLLCALVMLCGWWLVARRRTEEALRQSFREIQDLYQNAPCGYHSLDADGYFVQINDTELTLLGYEREELVGKKRLQDLLTPASQELFRENYPRFMARGWVRDLEMDLVHKDGTVVPTLISATAIKDDQGNFITTRSMVTDVSEHKQAALALGRSESSLAEAQRMAHLGNWEWDIAAGRHTWSDECFRIFGFEPKSIEPGHEMFMELLLPEDRDAVRQRIEMALSGDLSRCQCEYRIRRPDGEIRHLRGQLEVKAEAGVPLTVVGVHQDVTEQVKIQARLAQISRLYAVLSKANQAVVRIPDRNALLEEICRIAVEDGAFVMAWAGQIEDGNVVPVARWGREDGYLEQVRITIADRQLGSGPTGSSIREGRHFICDDIATDPRMAPWRELALARGYHASAAFPIREDGAVVGSISLYAAEPGYFSPQVVSLLDDLTEDVTFALDAHLQSARRQAAEENLRALNEQLERRVAERTRQLELANKELEAFSYSVSHDLRAPLRSIDGFSQVLLKRYADKLDDTGRDYLGRVRRASQRMGELIDDLLNLSRVTRSKIRRQPVDLSALARSLLEEMRRMAPERQVRCEVQDGLQTVGDLGLLRIVLENLLGNAWKFTGATAGAEIQFGCREENGQLVYFVRDNGAGFDQAYASKLFQVFQRLHSDSEFEGTGIGLATVHRIIQRHHGEVRAEGAIDQGASFFFTLPQLEEDGNPGPRQAGPVEIDRKESELTG